MLSACALLGACGSGSGDHQFQPEEAAPDYSNLSLADAGSEPLSVTHPVDSFARYLKNGVRLSQNGRAYVQDGEVTESPSAGDNSANGGYSQTNVHVAGVDEADRIKYDGQQLYIAKSAYYTYWQFTEDASIEEPGSPDTESQQQGIRILTTHPEQAEATAVTEISFDHRPEDLAHGVLSDLYLLENSQNQTQEVVAISDVYLGQGGAGGGSADSPMPMSYWQSSDSLIELFDVSSPANPRLSWSLELDGRLINSRKIGSTLYLITGYEPRLKGLDPWPESPHLQAANERRIAAADIEELLPSYRVDGGEAVPLVTPDNCFLPREISPNEGYADLVTVSAFDLQSRTLVSSVCLNAEVDGLYVSATSLYLGSSTGSWTDRQTGLHKFSLEGGQIDYRGTGRVRGTLNWNEPSFSMDEHEGYLRVVTSLQREHYLNVLRAQENSDELEVVASLPNEQEPAPIGKPNEDIYAVRFFDERAYIVTFERIDPLYVLDLSDNENPRIAGELEIPGFSTYLHPLGDDYLVSIGQGASLSGSIDGIKVELFDVRDIAKPLSLDRQLVGGEGSWSDALYDLRGFNFLKVGDDQLRFTLPITRRESHQWVDSGLYLYEVNGLAGEQAQLKAAGSIITETNQGQPGYYHPSQAGNGRSRLHGDAVYYVHGNQLWSSFWSSPEQVNGPY